MPLMIESKLANKFSYHWVRDNDKLEHICEIGQKQEAIFLDTEFIRRSTYWPKAALIQIRIAEKNFLVDPLTIDNWQPLIDIFANSNTTKVLHACLEDIAVFIRLTGTQSFKKIFDTQMAHAFASEHRHIGYSALVAKLLNIPLQQSSSIQKSNWLNRPLTEKQCQYGIQDVVYLAAIYTCQQQQLAKAPQHQKMVEAANEELIATVIQTYNNDYNKAYLDIKGIGRIKDKQVLARLHQLARWREQLAKKNNNARGFIIKDKVLLEIANNPPTTEQQWRDIEVGRFFDKNKHIPVLMDYLHRNYQAQEIPSLPQQFPSNYLETYRKMVEEKRQIAQELNICEHILANKKQLQTYIISKGNNTFGCWRDELLLPRLATHL